MSINSQKDLKYLENFITYTECNFKHSLKMSIIYGYWYLSSTKNIISSKTGFT